jgi:hypothetical protein
MPTAVWTVVQYRVNVHIAGPHKTRYDTVGTAAALAPPRPPPAFTPATEPAVDIGSRHPTQRSPATAVTAAPAPAAPAAPPLPPRPVALPPSPPLSSRRCFLLCPPHHYCVYHYPRSPSYLPRLQQSRTQSHRPSPPLLLSIFPIFPVLPAPFPDLGNEEPG